MIALKILLILLCLIVLILLLPIHVVAEYSAEGPRVTVGVLFLSIPILPKEKAEAEDDSESKDKKKKKKEKKQKKKKKEEKPKEEAGDSKKKSGGTIALLMELIPIGLQAVSYVWRKLRLSPLVLHLTVGGKKDDPAAAAILYGRAWAGLGNLVPVLEHAFRLGDRDISADIDFTLEENEIYAFGRISLYVIDIVSAAIRYGFKVLAVILKKRKERKKNGSSDQ